VTGFHRMVAQCIASSQAHPLIPGIQPNKLPLPGTCYSSISFNPRVRPTHSRVPGTFSSLYPFTSRTWGLLAHSHSLHICLKEVWGTHRKCRLWVPRLYFVAFPYTGMTSNPGDASCITVLWQPDIGRFDLLPEAGYNHVSIDLRPRAFRIIPYFPLPF
jgi:hypothetical protein